MLCRSWIEDVKGRATCVVVDNFKCVFKTGRMNMVCATKKAKLIPLVGILKRISKLGLILMMGIGMSACGAGTEKWKEEVQLSDGKVIIIDRETIREMGGDEWASNSSGTKPKEYHIRFEYPEGSGKIIEWRSIKKSPQTWPELPLVLDVESGLPILYSDVGDRYGCHVYSKYIYKNGTWIEEPLPPKFEERATNLLILSNRDKLPLIDLGTKRKKKCKC